MQQITFTKRADGTYRKIVPAQLIYKGEGPQGNCYQPEHLGKLSRQEAEEKYMSHNKYLQVKSDARKEELWNQIMENRKALSSIVLSTRHLADNKIVRPIPYEVNRFIKTCNLINRTVDKMFNYTRNSVNLLPRFQQPQIAM